MPTSAASGTAAERECDLCTHTLDTSAERPTLNGTDDPVWLRGLWIPTLEVERPELDVRRSRVQRARDLCGFSPQRQL